MTGHPILPLTVRRAQPQDAEALATLCAEHAAFERSEARRDPAWATRLAEALHTGRLHAWLLETPGGACGEAGPLPSLLGYASATLDYATFTAQPFMHLDCLYLQESVRGHGWGDRLMDAVKAAALAAGCTQLQWQTPDWNEPAARFYRRQGARMWRKQRFVLAL